MNISNRTRAFAWYDHRVGIFLLKTDPALGYGSVCHLECDSGELALLQGCWMVGNLSGHIEF